jgi:pimeloyl-ACP methyl ester carboxylesterase
MKAVKATPFPPGRQARPLVIALHCSGGNGRQWRKLAERLEPGAAFAAPDLHGAPGGPQWQGQGAFSLAREAEPVLALIDAHEGPVHLVGHSYGGGLALHVAAMRPDRIASLSLYEPSAFHLLKLFGWEGRAALLEIEQVANTIRQGLVNGAYRQAAATFVDYWNGTGAFDSLRPEQQDDLGAYVWKAALDFHALIEEPTPLSAYCGFGFPVLLARGQFAPSPTRLLAEKLADRIVRARLEIVQGAGHMGPLTHGDQVADLFANASGLMRLEAPVSRAA